MRRTTQALTHALVALVLEKRYDAITIQDLLDRADIGRSTFYAHYRGKDDLLLRSFEAMLARLDQALERDDAARPRRAPVRELFAHVASMRGFHRDLARAHMLDRLYQTGTSQLARTIARRLAVLPRRTKTATVPPEVTSQAYAGALFALLRWWVDHEAPYTPAQMDGLYHDLAGAVGCGPLRMAPRGLGQIGCARASPSLTPSRPQDDHGVTLEAAAASFPCGSHSGSARNLSVLGPSSGAV